MAEPEKSKDEKPVKTITEKELKMLRLEKKVKEVQKFRHEKEQHQVESEQAYKNSVSNSQKYTFFDSASTGFGQKYMEAFAAFLKATDFQFSLLVSLPQFIGGIIQLFTFNILNIFRSRKALNLTFAILESFIWLPVIYLAFMHSGSAAWAFIILMVLYFSISLIINPIWNSWIMDIVSTEERGKYFGNKALVVNLACLASFIAGGLILHASKVFYGNEAFGFALVFFLSLILNLVAASFMLRTYEPKYVIVQPKVSMANFVSGMRTDSQGWIIIYLSLMSFAVYVSSPFYALYLLKSLQMSYIEFAILIITPLIARILFVKRVGKVVDKFGPKKLLKIASFLIVFNPLLWLFGKSFAYLFLVQLYAGISYGIFEICAITYLVNSTSSENRISLLSYYNFFNGAFILLGALFSNIALNIGPYAIIYLNAFLISGIMRFLILLIPFPKVPERDMYEKAGYEHLTSEIFSSVAPGQLMKKTVAARDMTSIRIMDNDIIKKKPGSRYYAGQDDVEAVMQVHKKGEHEKLLKQRPKQEPMHSKKGVAITEYFYMCHHCNAEFKTINHAHKEGCPYCSSKEIIFLREKARIINTRTST